jgi:hypothetical protein
MCFINTVPVYEIAALVRRVLAIYNSITKFGDQEKVSGVLLVSLNNVPFEITLSNARLPI